MRNFRTLGQPLLGEFGWGFWSDLHKYLKAIDDNEQNFADDKFESEFDSFGAR